MSPVLVPQKTPYRWRVVLVGHVEDMELAVEALKENLAEAWIGFVQRGDDDESVVTITLKWLDVGMTQMVRNIIESDHDEIRIIYNGGVDEDGNRITT